MTPTVVLIKSPSTHPIMRSFYSNQTSFSTTTPSAISHNFGVYQHTTVGANDVTIRNLVPVSINATTYYKVLISNIPFRQILINVKTPSGSICDLISTVATYFDMYTYMDERETEITVSFIRDSIFCVNNMIGVDLLTSKGSLLLLIALLIVHFYYFTFRYKINLHLVDSRAPDNLLSFNFSLRLPHATPLTNSATFTICPSV